MTGIVVSTIGVAGQFRPYERTEFEMGFRRRTRRRAIIATAAVVHHENKVAAQQQQQEPAEYQDPELADYQDQGQPTPPPSDPADEIEHLAQLHASGVLTDEEFTAAKAKILGI